MPKACTATTLTFPAEAGARCRQIAPLYGTNEWVAFYQTTRSVNEGINEFAKRGNPIDNSDPNSRRFSGVMAQSDLHVTRILVVNLMLIESFLNDLRHDPRFDKKSARRSARYLKSKSCITRACADDAMTKDPPVLTQSLPSALSASSRPDPETSSDQGTFKSKPAQLDRRIGVAVNRMRRRSERSGWIDNLVHRNGIRRFTYSSYATPS